MVKKFLVLDLDNTFWGGVIGDDGNDFNYVNYNLNYFKDHSHFNYDVGKLILKKVFLDEGIGVKIAPNNIYTIDRLIKLK